MSSTEAEHLRNRYWSLFVSVEHWNSRAKVVRKRLARNDAITVACGPAFLASGTGVAASFIEQVQKLVPQLELWLGGAAVVMAVGYGLRKYKRWPEHLAEADKMLAALQDIVNKAETRFEQLAQHCAQWYDLTPTKLQTLTDTEAELSESFEEVIAKPHPMYSEFEIVEQANALHRERLRKWIAERNWLGHGPWTTEQE